MTSPSATLWRDAVDHRANEHVRRWLRHFPRLRATYLERWIAPLQAMALPAECLELTPRQRDLLIDESWRRQTDRPSLEPDDFDDLVEALERLVLRAQARSEEGAAFVRIGSCAPLDSRLAQESVYQVDGGSEALEVLLESERVFDALCLDQECAYATHVVMRPWQEIVPDHEVRAVVRAGELVALRRRHVDAPPSIGGAEAAVRARLPQVAAVLPGADLLIDLFVHEGQAWLIDLAPLAPKAALLST